ncbi:alpha/beta fold hydrolase [Sedimenticola hydrogenitrophicus]|uniref:alpha/beta fold hydrolase n=1 Tax=Sedimenticola hydrogenitrophicus TaxID=2967975 RepID=UPI0021A9332E|nr:alpha/beta hydrolase [Sedimenticola hydrogenitrophicus]
MDNESKTYLTLNGTRLECQWFGQPDGDRPVLVLLHEGLGCVDMWRDFPRRLAQQTGLAVFVYSRQGYGGSDPFAHPLDVDFMHREGMDILPAVLDAAGIGQAFLVGHSDGASISLIYAGERTDPRDPRILGLVLLAPHLFVEEETLHGIRQAKQDYDSGSLAERLRRYHLDHTESTFRHWSGIWLDPRFESWNIEASLPGIEVPLLAVMGEDDQYGTLAQIHTLAERLPQWTELAILKDCGHSPHLEQPERTLELVCDFLEKQR